jgi:hypothetical protein
MKGQSSKRKCKAYLLLSASEHEEKKESIINVYMEDILRSFQETKSKFERMLEESETALLIDNTGPRQENEVEGNIEH